jgi:hypothetical protein
LVTYHPSYYLRSPEQKAKGWQDLQRMLEFLAQDTAEKTDARARAQQLFEAPRL